VAKRKLKVAELDADKNNSCRLTTYGYGLYRVFSVNIRWSADLVGPDFITIELGC